MEKNFKKLEKEINLKVKNLGKAKERENRVEQGYFDGRFANKKFLDRKKEQNKRACKDFSWN